MKVTSTKAISFPKLGWAIDAGETKDLPESKEAQELILSSYPEITPVGEGKAKEIISNKSNKDN